MTRSGKYTDAEREEQLRKDKEKRELEAANRRLKKAYANAERQAGQQGMQQPLPEGDVQLSGEDSDHEFHDVGDVVEGGDGGEGAGGAGNHGNIPQQVMVNYDVDNGADDADFYKKKVEVKYDPEDLQFWFMQLEDAMQWSGIRGQYTKRQCLVQNLPPEIRSEIKGLLRLNKDQAGTQPYKDAKDRLMQLFGPDESDAYEKATQLVLVGKPSQLAKKLADLLCKCQPPLKAGCCAAPSVIGMWKAKLPAQVKAAIAGKTLMGDQFEPTLKLADDVWKSVCAKPVSAITDGASGGSAADPDQLAAFNKRGGGKQNKGNHNKGQGNNNAGQKANNQQGAGQKRKPRHPDNPPENSCSNHWQYGKSAYCCLAPFKCPWKDNVTPRPERK